MKFAAIFVLFANAFSAGMMFLASVFISRYGGKDLFGFFSVILGLIISAAPVVTFGMDTAIVRFLPKYREEGKRRLVSGMQRFVLAFAALLSILGGIVLATILVHFRNYSLEIGFAAGVCLPLAVILSVLQGAIRADANVSRAVVGEAVVRPLIFAVCLLSLYFWLHGELTLLSVVSSYAIALNVAMVSALYLVIRGGHIKWRSAFHPRMADIRLWLQLGLNVLFSQLSIALLNQSPVVLAGVLLSAFDAGEIGAVIRLAMLVAFALTAVNSVVAPFLSRAMAKDDTWELQSLVSRATGFSLLVAVPVCGAFFIFAPELLSLFGNDYTGAVPYLRMMLIAYAVQAACGPSVALLNMTGIHRAMTKIVSVWAGLTVIGLAVAMLQVGMLGGVVIAAVSVAGYPLILAILCRKTLGVDPTVLSLRYLVAR
ncbi:oligosaccharide flippase family protein [Thalassospira sp. GO-4]|uniref:oligosaccharide flippase family protein n=1 Tax=Thalassospira sp. GO-4 TaxID=2946605 RepID=UPI0020251370|nr:oligosaccharide flippase family protein [Thalassospira sp. GO-4]URK17725.1 oligosaccharide flippase family protein [Thalassospira sp. GO-4]